MKKIIMLLAISTSFVLMAGCASKACQSCYQPSSSIDTQPVHHNYKGDVPRS